MGQSTGLWGKMKLSVFGIGPAVLGRPASRLIHPHSPFAKGVVLVTVMFLLYTAVVVPVTVGFFWTSSSCYRMPTLEVDLVMDTFFLLQIVYTFFLGQYRQEEYTDELMTVAERYLRGAFAFDLITSCPVSYLDLWVLVSQCGDAGGDAQNLSGLRIIRALKPLRLLKMVRILRIFRILHVFDMIENLLRPPPLLFRVFRVLFMIGALGHACTCTFWLIKTQYSDEETVADFTEYHGIGRDPGLEQQYILAAYFVNTIFTTVGFGDISASNTAEQLFCVVVMYAGTIVFGVLLSEIEMAVSSMRAFPRRKGRLVQELMGFLSDKDVPSALQKKVLEWVEFDLHCRYEEEMREQCLQLVPPQLRSQVVDQLHHDELYRVPLFASISNRYRERLLIDLWDAMLPRSFMAGAVIAEASEPADRLFVVMAGKVEAQLEDGASLVTLGSGDFFGEYTLVGDTRWGAEVGVEVSYVATQATLCRVLPRERFEEIVKVYPEELWEEVNKRGEEHRLRTERAREEASQRRQRAPDDAAAATGMPRGELVRQFSKKEVRKEEEREALRRFVVCTARWTWVVRKATLLARVSKMDSFDLMDRLMQRLRDRQGPLILPRSRSSDPTALSQPAPASASAFSSLARSDSISSGRAGAESPSASAGPTPKPGSPPRHLLTAPPPVPSSPVTAVLAEGRAHPFSEGKAGYEESARGQAPPPNLGLHNRRTSISSLNDEFDHAAVPWEAANGTPLAHAGDWSEESRRRRRFSGELDHPPAMPNGTLPRGSSIRGRSPTRPAHKAAEGEQVESERLGELVKEVERLGGGLERQQADMAAQREVLGALRSDVAAIAASLDALSQALLPAIPRGTPAHAGPGPSPSGSASRLLQPLPRSANR